MDPIGHPIRPDNDEDVLAVLSEAMIASGFRHLPSVGIPAVLGAPYSHYKFNTETLRELGWGHLTPDGGGFIVTVDEEGEMTLYRYADDPELEQGWAAVTAHLFRV